MNIFFLMLVSSLFTVNGNRSTKKISKITNLGFLSTNINTEIYNKSKSKSKFEPRGVDQGLYVKYLNDVNTKIIAGVGTAGTGKTLFACDTAMKLLFQGDISKIILTRPLITVNDENLGFLPGTMNSKMNPWLLPVYDIFREYMTQKEIDKKVSEGIIEICPLGYMRGRTFKDCFIIADEMQNSTPSQILMLMTRLGANCKLAITGDLVQSDISGINGLSDFVDKYNMLEHREAYVEPPSEIQIVHFGSYQIERSNVVKQIIEIYSSTCNYNSHYGFYN